MFKTKNRLAAMIITYCFGAFGLLIAFLTPLQLGALGTERLIEYEGKITQVEREKAFRRRFIRNGVNVTVLYDGGQIETHEIDTSLKVYKLDQIAKDLRAHRGEPVIVTFLPNDRTLAEIRTFEGELLLPQSQLSSSTMFTAWGIGISSILMIAIGVGVQLFSKPEAIAEGSA